MSLLLKLRKNFLTGIMIAAPIGITFYIVISFVQLVDDMIRPIFPDAYNPENYLPFNIPGIGFIFVIIILTFLGAVASHFMGAAILSYGQILLKKLPLIRNLYTALKQIFETVLLKEERNFKEVGLIEFPRLGVYAIVFLSASIRKKGALSPGDENEMISVLLPTAPNPTSGFLLFVKRKELILLDISVEDAAKIVISAGILIPENVKFHFGTDFITPDNGHTT
ncbi:MAG: DUF502 domain-containing protein [Alphaproteobacteria bacterium]|nr:DUF502 domain-containing protein [Alphaproteobacteria bacterium]